MFVCFCIADLLPLSEGWGMLGLFRANIWGMLGLFRTNIWGMLGLFRANIWGMLGLFRANIWGMLGLFRANIWGMLGLFRANIWGMLGLFRANIWGMLGLFRANIWGMLGLFRANIMLRSAGVAECGQIVVCSSSPLNRNRIRNKQNIETRTKDVLTCKKEWLHQIRKTFYLYYTICRDSF